MGIARTALPALAVLLLPQAAAAVAQEVRTAVPGAAAPAARIADLAWLEGSWSGTGLGGVALEVYSAPSGGQIIGHFRQTRSDGTVLFYELTGVAEHKGSLVWRIKHFNADMTAREEKAEVVTFPLVGVEADVWYFDGMTVRRTGPGTMTMTVRISRKDGTSFEAPFRYARTGSAPSP